MDEMNAKYIWKVHPNWWERCEVISAELFQNWSVRGLVTGNSYSGKPRFIAEDVVLI